jgi:hypothetical protein
MLTHMSDLFFYGNCMVFYLQLYWIRYIHSPEDGYLSHSQFYTITDNTEANMLIHLSPWSCFSRYTTHKSTIASPQGKHISTFLDITKWLSRVDDQLSTPYNNVVFPHMFSNI